MRARLVSNTIKRAIPIGTAWLEPGGSACLQPLPAVTQPFATTAAGDESRHNRPQPSRAWWGVAVGLADTWCCLLMSDPRAFTHARRRRAATGTWDCGATRAHALLPRDALTGLPINTHNLAAGLPPPTGREVSPVAFFSKAGLYSGAVSPLSLLGGGGEVSCYRHMNTERHTRTHAAVHRWRWLYPNPAVHAYMQ